MVAEVEDAINKNPNSLPAAEQYNSEADPEYDAAQMKEAFYNGYVYGEHIAEAFTMKGFIEDYFNKNGIVPMDQIQDALPTTGTAGWYKKHPEKLKPAYDKVMLKYQAVGQEVAPQFTIDDLENDLARELASTDLMDNVMSAKESAADKFQEVYNLAATIFTGRGIKHHGFIHGMGGVGKCVLHDTKLKIILDDTIAQEFESYLQLKA